MSSTTERRYGCARDHYSYSHYASRGRRRRLRRAAVRRTRSANTCSTCQQSLLRRRAVAGRAAGPSLDVGTGTGRAAIGLAQSGAAVIGVDASPEMLRVARREGRRRVGRAYASGWPTPMRCRSPTGSVDAVVCLRVLMHAIDWRTCVAELCRVARWRVVVDFPSSSSAAALESGARRIAKSLGRHVEAYRVIAERDVLAALAGARLPSGHRPAAVRAADCVSQSDRPARVHAGRSSAGSRLSGSPDSPDRRSRWWPSGEGARHGSHRLHRRTSGAVSRRAGRRRPRARARSRQSAASLASASIEIVQGDLTDRASLERAMAGVEVVYNIAALYREAGLSAAAYRAVNATAVGEIVTAREARRRPPGRALQHRRRARRRRASACERGRAIPSGRRLPGDQARRRARRRAKPPARAGMEFVIVRPSGHLRSGAIGGCSRCSARWRSDGS